MNESNNRNSWKMSVLIWCTAAVMLALVLLKLAEMGNMQLVPFATIQVTSDLIWQIPLIPRWLDAILIALIWATILASLKSLEDDELRQVAFGFSVFGFLTVVSDGLIWLHGSSLFAGAIEGLLAGVSILLLGGVWKIAFRRKYPRAQSCMIVAIGYMAGMSFVYAIFHGVTYGILSMLVSIAMAEGVIAFVLMLSDIVIYLKKIATEKTAKVPEEETAKEVAEESAKEEPA